VEGPVLLDPEQLLVTLLQAAEWDAARSEMRADELGANQIERGPWWEDLLLCSAPAGVGVEAWSFTSAYGRALLLLRVLRTSTEHPPSRLCHNVLACDWQNRPDRAGLHDVARRPTSADCPEHTFADCAAVLAGRLTSELAERELR
jgi:hypothetical protein